MKVLVLRQPFPMGNYKLCAEVANYFAQDGNEVYLLEQLNGRQATQEYADALIEQDFDLIYFENLDFESYKIVEQLKGQKVLTYISTGVLDNHDEILKHKGVWYDKIFTNSKLLADKYRDNGVPTEHFEYYFSPIPEDEKVFTPQYNNECSFLGMGFGRLSSPDYALERDIFFREQSFEFSVYGNGWQNAPYSFCKGILPPDDIGKLYTSTKSAVATIASGQREVGMINNRYSELGSCGTPIVTYNYDEIDWYGADKYLNFVSNQTELTETINDILKNPDSYKQKTDGFKTFIDKKSKSFFDKLNVLITKEY